MSTAPLHALAPAEHRRVRPTNPHTLEFQASEQGKVEVGVFHASECERTFDISISEALDHLERLSVAIREASSNRSQHEALGRLRALGWSESYESAALREGWTLSPVPDTQTEYEVQGTVSGPFASRTALLTHLQARADEDSLLHLTALRIRGPQSVS